MLRALGSDSCDIIHETAGTISYGQRLAIARTSQGVRFVTGIGFCDDGQKVSASCDITQETGGTSVWHWVLFLVISYAR